jgi:hypothetical protein
MDHVESESKLILARDGLCARGTFFIAASRPLAAATRHMIEHRDVLVKSEVPRGTFKRD